MESYVLRRDEKSKIKRGKSRMRHHTDRSTSGCLLLVDVSVRSGVGGSTFSIVVVSRLVWVGVVVGSI